MKKIFGFLITAIAFTFYSCSDDSDGLLEAGSALEIAVEDISLEATSTAMMEDIDEAADLATAGGTTGGRMRFVGFGGKRFGDCVIVTEDQNSGTKTIDFGDEGCEGRDGRVRRGKIIITHEGERDVPGFKRTITLENFSIDTMTIEGTRVLTYVSGTDTEKIGTAVLTGGKITFPDGTTATRASTRTRVASFDAEGEKYQAYHYGSASGLNRDGLTYTCSIEESTPILFVSACRDQGSFAPVSGMLTIAVEGESDKVIDFGDGTCDNQVIITQDGVSNEVEIDPRHRRQRKHRGGS